MLYVKLQNKLYGLFCIALLFYLKLVTDLKINGFSQNPYNPYVENKLVNGEMIKVVWHANDIKVPHKDPFEVNKFATNLSTIYGKKPIVHRVKLHGYLGIHFY